MSSRASEASAASDLLKVRMRWYIMTYVLIPYNIYSER